MRTPGLACLAVVFVMGTAPAAATPGEPPSVGLDERADHRVFQVALGGRLEARSRVCTGDACRPLFLVQDVGGDGLRSLITADLSAHGEATVLATGLPEAIDSIAAATVAGGASILLGELGRIFTLSAQRDPGTNGPALAPRLLLERPRLDLAAILSQSLLSPDVDVLAVPWVASLDLYEGDGAGALRLWRKVALPARAERVRAGLLLISPPVTWLPASRQRGAESGRGPSDAPLLVVGPEAQGGRRLRTLLVDPFADVEEEAERVVLEAWSLLPSPEEVEWSGVFDADGVPMLAVTTLRSDKVGLLEKKKVRVFALREDRTREGLPPLFERVTSSRRWQRLDVQFHDADLDGRLDLILVQPEGYDGDKLLVDVFLGEAGGRFSSAPRRSVIDTPEARWTYGADVNCDGRPDLAVISEARLHIFEGLGQLKKKAVLDEQARWSLSVSLRHPSIDWRELAEDRDQQRLTELHGWRTIWTDDVDGDGCDEILVVGVTPKGGDVIQVFDVSVGP